MHYFRIKSRDLTPFSQISLMFLKIYDNGSQKIEGCVNAPAHQGPMEDEEEGEAQDGTVQQVSW